MGLRSEVLLKREEKNPAKEMLYRLLAGIVVIGLIEEMVLLFLCADKTAATIGLLLGLWVAAVNSVYIYRSLGKALELDEKNSVKAMRGPVLVRYCFMGMAVTAGLLKPQIFSPAGVILGLLSMKVSAYVQPFFMETPRLLSADLTNRCSHEDSDFVQRAAPVEKNPDAELFPEDDGEEEESPWGFGIFHNGNSRTDTEMVEKSEKSE